MKVILMRNEHILYIVYSLYIFNNIIINKQIQIIVFLLKALKTKYLREIK